MGRTFYRRPGIIPPTVGGPSDLQKRFTDAYDSLPSEGEPPGTASGVSPRSLQRSNGRRSGPLAIRHPGHSVTERIRTRRWRYFPLEPLESVLAGGAL